MTVSVRPSGPRPDLVADLLAALPEWFGMPAATAAYVVAAQRLPTLVAEVDGAPVGVLLHERPFATAASIHLLAVAPTHHRHGVGRALVDLLVRVAAADGVRVISVATLGPSDPDPYYAGTRAFYDACGFVPVEELEDVWPGSPRVLLVRPL